MNAREDLFKRSPIIVVHGGAGVPPPDRIPDKQRSAVQAGITAALMAGRASLLSGASAIEAVVAAVAVLEDDPTFNAGRGAALTSEGFAEHDAAIMCGATLQAGASTGTRRVRNPVKLAHSLLVHGPHVFLAGSSAEFIAKNRDLAIVESEYFITPQRQLALQKAQKSGDQSLGEEARHGTVGAVALDAHGHLAAATSTGGLTNKLPGRIGDTPILGAGTFANDSICAVSATGRGEYFMRTVFAHRIACLIELANMPLAQAAEKALAEVEALGGTGGVIALDATGQPVFSFNGHGLYRGFWSLETSLPTVSIYHKTESCV